MAHLSQIRTDIGIVNGRAGVYLQGFFELFDRLLMLLEFEIAKAQDIVDFLKIRIKLPRLFESFNGSPILSHVLQANSYVRVDTGYIEGTWI